MKQPWFEQGQALQALQGRSCRQGTEKRTCGPPGKVYYFPNLFELSVEGIAYLKAVCYFSLEHYSTENASR
jgi:hypothetical protein